MTVPYLGVYCATCEQDCLPIHRRCGFCDELVVDGDGNALHTQQPKEAPVALCKVDGCDNPSAGKGGWCAGLCHEHISEEGQRRQRVRYAKTQPSKKPPKAIRLATVPAPAAPSSLVELAQAVEDAKASLELALAALREAVAPA